MPFYQRSIKKAWKALVQKADLFYRNAINIGLLALECPMTEHIRKGDRLRLALDVGILYNLNRSEEYPVTSMPGHMLQPVEAGGLIPYLERYRLR